MKKITTPMKREQVAEHAPCSVVEVGLLLQKCWVSHLVSLIGTMLQLLKEWEPWAGEVAGVKMKKILTSLGRKRKRTKAMEKGRDSNQGKSPHNILDSRDLLTPLEPLDLKAP